jgi:phenylpropionate dioxygenase-like ring-hydroxylating dioxygenase large terminal subunit
VHYPGLERGALGLHEIALETWLGFVFIAFEPPSGTVADLLGPCTSELEPYRFPDMRRISVPRLRPRRANWKVICENYLDSYHLAVAHPTLKQVVGRSYSFEDRGAAMRITGEIDAACARNWSARAYARWLPDQAQLPPARRRLWAYYFIWPNLALDVYPDQIDFMQMLPTDSGETVIREIAYALPDTRREMRLVRYLNWRVNRQVSKEDQRLVERMQLGLAGEAYEPGPIADDEDGLRWFTARALRSAPGAGGGQALASARQGATARRKPRRRMK